MKWKLQIDQLWAPQHLVDKIIEEKQREYSQSLVQTIARRTSSVMPRSIGKASGL
jgi:ribosomal protein S19